MGNRSILPSTRLPDLPLCLLDLFDTVEIEKWVKLSESFDMNGITKVYKNCRLRVLTVCSNLVRQIRIVTKKDKNHIK